VLFLRDGLEDPLDDLGMVQQQLEQLSVIGRCEYQKTCSLLVNLFDQAAGVYQEQMASPSSNQMDITIQEGEKRINTSFDVLFLKQLRIFFKKKRKNMHIWQPYEAVLLKKIQ